MKNLFVFAHLFIIYLCIVSVQCAKILCIFQMPAFSHQATFQPIARELSIRGHKVISVTPKPINDSLLVNLTEIDISDSFEIVNRHGFEFFMSKEHSVHQKIVKIFNMYYELQEAIFTNNGFKNIYTDSKQKFDLVIAQIYVSPTMFALGEKFKAPVIGVSSMNGWLGTNVAAGNHNPPSMFSEMFLHYNGKLTFYERFKSTLYYVWHRLYLHFVAIPKCDALAKKYLGNDLSYLADIERNVSALFLNINPILYPPRPTVPTVVPMIFMHTRSPKPLPEDLLREIESAKNGVIYFSLGSNVKSVNIPVRIRNILINTFATLPYKILWKFEGEELPEKPRNVIIRKWLPQQDILAHPNVKAFVTQGGLQSTEEAIDRGMPLVMIPFIADQEMNAKLLEPYNVRRWIDYLTTTEKELAEAITDVAENPMYRQNMKKLSNLLKDQPMDALEKVVWWSEYVIRHKGTKHLRSPMVDIEWYKYFLLDVLGAVFLSLTFFFYLLAKLFQLLYRQKKKKAKKN